MRGMLAMMRVTHTMGLQAAREGRRMKVTQEMVQRFLGWRLPQDFRPDAGIRFDPPEGVTTMPIGTNLLTATQAREMLEYILAYVPDPPAPPADDLEAGVRLAQQAVLWSMFYGDGRGRVGELREHILGVFGPEVDTELRRRYEAARG